MKKMRDLRMAANVVIHREYDSNYDDQGLGAGRVCAADDEHVTDWLVRGIAHVIIVTDDSKQTEMLLDLNGLLSKTCQSPPIIVRLADIQDPSRMAMRIKDIADRLSEVDR